MEQQLFDLMTKMYNEMQESNKQLRDEMQSMRVELNEKLDKKSDKQDIVNLEYSLTEKIAALFDAREVQIDKEIELSTNVKRVENKLDKLELKVVRSNIK